MHDLPYKNLRDQKPQKDVGRPQEWTFNHIYSLENDLKKQSVPCPSRTVNHPSEVIETRTADGGICRKPKIMNVRELVRPLEACLRACDVTYETKEKRPGKGKGSETESGLKRISMRQARKLVKSKLTWFQDAQSKWFVCKHCNERCNDATMLNASVLDCYMIIDDTTRRNRELENDDSCDAPRDVAQTLHPSRWLPTEEEMRMELNELHQTVTTDEAEKLIAARNRLHRFVAVRTSHTHRRVINGGWFQCRGFLFVVDFCVV